MLHRNVVRIFSLLFCLTATSLAAAEGDKRPVDCAGCHDASVNHKMEAMITSKHWDKSNQDTPVSKEGCQSCHGDSHRHASAPTRIQPDVSFGPHWTASVDKQNDTCLTCHEKTATHNQWRQGVHASQDVTCVTCHDVHEKEDKVRVAGKQGEVCTVCHKVQQSGIHHMEAKLGDNPECSSCHNPHANPSPTVMMLANRSEGCRTCHDFQAMEKDSTVSEKAKSYHRVMASDDRTCVDCHRGVAHVDESNFGKLLAGGLTAAPMNLFYPAQSDGDWLLEEHKGAQSLRQGRNCRQCHLGDAEKMGQNLAPKGIDPSVRVNVSVRKVANNMELTVKWAGSANDNGVAVMFDNGLVDEFGREGCWAACHSDMPGMTRDRGQGLKKYLMSSKKQQRSVGMQSESYDSATLSKMRSNGEFVELWRATLTSGSIDNVRRYSILDSREEQPLGKLNATAKYSNGKWTVTFVKPINDDIKPFINDKTVTFGIAIHGDGASDAQHKVSLPLTMSFDGKDTDFVLK